MVLKSGRKRSEVVGLGYLRLRSTRSRFVAAVSGVGGVPVVVTGVYVLVFCWWLRAGWGGTSETAAIADGAFLPMSLAFGLPDDSQGPTSRPGPAAEVTPL